MASAQNESVVDVFISHTGQDNAALVFAGHLKHMLDDQGIVAFFDADTLQAGDLWKEKIRDYVGNSLVFVAILSPTYFKRYWCMHELDIAMATNKTILPVYYCIDGPENLPTNERAFCRRFRNDKRLSSGEAKKWYTNVRGLSKYHSLRRSNFVTKNGDVCLKKEVVTSIRQLLEHGCHSSPPTPRALQPTPQALQGGTESIFCCAVFSSGTKALSGNGDNSLRVHDLTTGKILQTLHGHSDPVFCCQVFAGGKRALSGSSDSTLRVWDLPTCETLQILRGHSNTVASCTVFDNGTKALSCSYDNTLRVWDIASGETRKVLSGHQGCVFCCTVYENDTKALSGSWDKTLKVWKLDTGETLHTLQGHNHAVFCCTVFANGTKALSGSQDKSLKMWDLTTLEMHATFQGHVSSVRCCAVFQDGTKALSGSDDSALRVWDLVTGKGIETLQGHTSSVRCCTLFASDTKLLSGSVDRTLRVWQGGSWGREFHLQLGATHYEGTSRGSLDKIEKAMYHLLFEICEGNTRTLTDTMVGRMRMMVAQLQSRNVRFDNSGSLADNNGSRDFAELASQDEESQKARRSGLHPRPVTNHVGKISCDGALPLTLLEPPKTSKPKEIDSPSSFDRLTSFFSQLPCRCCQKIEVQTTNQAQQLQTSSFSILQ